MGVNEQLIGGRYRIQRKLGEGGMATVYLAIDEKLGRAVAIKILHDHMEKNEEIRKRFQHEAQAISGLDHPNIVKIYDFSGFNSERLWFVTEIIKGKNLADETEKWPAHMVHPVIATCFVRETCRALAHAHSFGIVHRDIKPENIMITNDGILKLMDFGIAKIQQKSSVTITGTFMGSPSYMSPEQIRGRNIDHRSDLYSVCVLFYELLTAKLPFVGQTTHDVIMKIMDGNYSYPRFLAANLNQEIDAFVVKGMSRNPDQRFSSALEMEKILQNILIDLGFDESQVELQRYFRDPETYREKALSSKKKTHSSTLHLTERPTQKTPDSPATISAKNQLAVDHPISKALAEKRYQVDPAAYLKTAHLAPQEPTVRFELAPRRDRTVPPQYIPVVTKVVNRPAPAPVMIPPPPPIHVNIAHPPVQNHVARRAPRSFPRVPQRVQVIHRRNHFTVRVPDSGANGFFVFLLFVAIIGGLVWTFSESNNIQSNIQQGIKKISRIHTKQKPVRPNPTEAPQKQMIHVEPVEETIAKPIAPPVETPVHHTAVKTTPAKVEKKVTDNQKPKPTVTFAPMQKKPVAPVPGSLPPLLPTVANSNTETENTSPTKKEVEPVETPTPKTAPVGDGFVFISSQPAAEIYWRGKKLGTTIDSGVGSGWLKISTGSQVIELRRSGYQTRTVDFSLKQNERKRLGGFTLAATGQATVPQLYYLTVAVTPTPAQVTIVHLDKNKTDRFTLNSESRVFTLERGNYEVTVEKDGQKQVRNLNLSGKNNSYTFTARFKKPETKEEGGSP